jgi:hypothetical protein
VIDAPFATHPVSFVDAHRDGLFRAFFLTRRGAAQVRVCVDLGFGASQVRGLALDLPTGAPRLADVLPLGCPLLVRVARTSGVALSYRATDVWVCRQSHDGVQRVPLGQWLRDA